MKTMKNFAAQQLTKNQMNEIRGGQQEPFDNCGKLYLAVWVGGSNYVCEKDKKAIIEYVRKGAGLIEISDF